MKTTIGLFVCIVSVLYASELNIEKRQRNGKTVGAYSYPYVVELQILEFSILNSMYAQPLKCTAAILSPNVIISAAHCFRSWAVKEWWKDTPSGTIKVRVNPDKLSGITLSELWYRLAQDPPYILNIPFQSYDLYFHPSYKNPLVPGYIENFDGRPSIDIAIIYLKDERAMSFFKQSDFLRFPKDTEVPIRGQWGESLGFGQTCKGECKSLKQYSGKVPLITEVRLGKDQTASWAILGIQAGGNISLPNGEHEIRGPSKGDSGGPLICHEPRPSIALNEPYKTSFICGVLCVEYGLEAPLRLSGWMNVTMPIIRDFVEPFLANDIGEDLKPMETKHELVTGAEVGAKARVGILGVGKRFIDYVNRRLF